MKQSGRELITVREIYWRVRLLIYCVLWSVLVFLIVGWFEVSRRKFNPGLFEIKWQIGTTSKALSTLKLLANKNRRESKDWKLVEAIRIGRDAIQDMYSLAGKHLNSNGKLSEFVRSPSMGKYMDKGIIRLSDRPDSFVSHIALTKDHMDIDIIGLDLDSCFRLTRDTILSFENGVRGVVMFGKSGRASMYASRNGHVDCVLMIEAEFARREMDSATAKPSSSKGSSAPRV